MTTTAAILKEPQGLRYNGAAIAYVLVGYVLALSDCFRVVVAPSAGHTVHSSRDDYRGLSNSRVWPQSGKFRRVATQARQIHERPAVPPTASTKTCAGNIFDTNDNDDVACSSTMRSCSPVVLRLTASSSGSTFPPTT